MEVQSAHSSVTHTGHDVTALLAGTYQNSTMLPVSYAAAYLTGLSQMHSR